VTGEQVLVVPRQRIMGPRAWRGILSRGTEPYLAAIAEAGRFEPRAAMERDPGFKQVIPYLVLRDRGRYFLMRRTRAGGDERLHERFSIGVGGHLNPGDVDLAGGLVREWSEELAADFVPEFRLLGLLNDDETDVGRVHLGVVYLAEAAGRPVAVRETDKLEGRFVTPADLLAVYDRMETWSQLVFDFVSGRAAGVRGGEPGTGREAPRRY
jgi:predicted NUDIX family phosphoesterase